MVADALCGDIRDLEQRWRDALFAKDAAALRKLIHPDFKLVGVRSTGSVAVDLEQWLVALTRMDVASLDVRVIDAVALPSTLVGTIEAQWKVRYLGQLIDERVLLTDVWVKNEAGDWQVVRRHSSPVPAGACIG